MTAVASLPCPYQRGALLVARWSGARRGEICRLAVDCLDVYPDGTARLRIPAGKTLKERVVPLHEEAAEALRAIIALRSGGPERPLLEHLPPRYAFRLEDLRAFHLVRASCHACANKAIIPHTSLRRGRPGYTRLIELERQLRCRKCGARGRASLNVVFRPRLNYSLDVCNPLRYKYHE